MPKYDDRIFVSLCTSLQKFTYRISSYKTHWYWFFVHGVQVWVLLEKAKVKLSELQALLEVRDLF